MGAHPRLESLREIAGAVCPLTKVSPRGIVLVPQPSDDPNDPLNWSTARKVITLVVVNLAAFAGTVQALANASGFHPQAELYGVTVVQMSYSISAAIAGLAVGPLFWSPLAGRCGKCACIFWSLILTLCMNIWSANMTKSNQYHPFVISRLFAALFSSAPTSLGAGVIMETFFLHDRGKCFAIYSTSILLGVVAAATFSGFIVESAPWTVQFWFNVGFEGLMAILCILFLDETRWPRSERDPPMPIFGGFIARKVATYLLTHRIMPKQPKGKALDEAIRPFLVIISPITVCIGCALLIYFAWNVTIATFLTVYLQEPVQAGGYGFSPLQNAAFTFTQWLGVLAAQIYGHYLNDRLPLAICARTGGTWKAEYRLHSLWIPVLIITPLGLGLFGATLHHHWHYMVLALATFLVTFGSVSGVPPAVNYVAECFAPRLAHDVTAALNLYRLVLGLAITFFVVPWADRVGVEWVYGTMAFLTIVAFGLVIVAMRMGPRLRMMSLAGMEEKEERVTIVRGRG